MPGAVGDPALGLSINACMQRWGDAQEMHSEAHQALQHLGEAAAAEGITVESLDEAANVALVQDAERERRAPAAPSAPHDRPVGIVPVCCDMVAVDWVSSCPSVRAPSGQWHVDLPRVSGELQRVRCPPASPGDRAPLPTVRRGAAVELPRSPSGSSAGALPKRVRSWWPERGSGARWRIWRWDTTNSARA
jgi:hypothetical protein